MIFALCAKFTVKIHWIMRDYFERIGLWKLCLAMVFVSLSIFGCNEEEPVIDEQATDLEGSVTDVDGNKIIDAQVSLYTGGINPAATSVTNAEGQYAFEGLGNAPYAVELATPLSTDIISDNPVSTEIINGVAEVIDFEVRQLPTEATLVLGDVDLNMEVTNVNLEVPTDPGEFIYTVNRKDPEVDVYPVLAPDGHQVTLAEWEEARGIAKVVCNGDRSTYEFAFRGLIPGGVYTVWLYILNSNKSPGEPLDFDADVSASGALGSGTTNIFEALETGPTTFSLEVGAGPLSIKGEAPPCALTGAPGMMLMINYHIDGNTHGDTQGPDKDDVPHLLVYFE